MEISKKLTEQERKVLSDLRARGFVVAVFNPKELAGANATRVEDRMVEMGWDVIACLKPTRTKG